MSLLKAFSTKKRCYQCFKICYFIIHQNQSSGFGNEVSETCLKDKKNPVPKFTSHGDCLYLPGLQLVTLWLHSTVDEGIWFRYETERQKVPFTFSGKYILIEPVRTLQLNLSTTTATLGTEESGHCREVETSMNVWNVCQKYGRCREVAIVERWPLLEVQLYTKVNHCKTECNNTMVVLVQQAQYSKLPPSLAQFSPADPDIIVYTGYGMQKVVQFYSLSQKKVQQLR